MNLLRKKKKQRELINFPYKIFLSDTNSDPEVNKYGETDSSLHLWFPENLRQKEMEEAS